MPRSGPFAALSTQARALRALTPQLKAIRAQARALGPMTPDTLRLAMTLQRDLLAADLVKARGVLEAAVRHHGAARTPEEQAEAWDRAQRADALLTRATHRALDARVRDVYALVLAACETLQGTTVDVLGEPVVWRLQPYDVQILGALALHQGRVAEMATGEGKTLVAAFPLVLASLAGEGAHLVTANSYLARRDAALMGALYAQLGLTVGCVDGTPPESAERRAAYACDITYGTTQEFGFDYLRDNLALSRAQQVQRGHAYALIDEADAVLIDEARTPLVISGSAGGDTVHLYAAVRGPVRNLVAVQETRLQEILHQAGAAWLQGDRYSCGVALATVRRADPRHLGLRALLASNDELEGVLHETASLIEARRRTHELDEEIYYSLDPAERAVGLTDRGMQALFPDEPEAFVVRPLQDTIAAIEADRSLDARTRADTIAAAIEGAGRRDLLLNAVHQMLKAQTLMVRDVDYVVTERGVEIVDVGTGRTMDGRRWSNGLHMAVEVKEGAPTVGETQTSATITIQHYYRKYARLAGMTGTAESAREEFATLYGLRVLAIPTHRPLVRQDRHDLIVRTTAQRDDALVREIQRLHALRLPVLVGTDSVGASERISAALTGLAIPHTVLNAKQHQAEAALVAHAGESGAVTVATNMAGRGTDIVLAPETREPRTVAWCRAQGLDPRSLPESYDAARALPEEGELPDDLLVECGGLHVLGMGRNPSLRVDRQLRGRAGRQGDPGASQYVISLEDPLLREFGSERILAMLNTVGMLAQGGMSSRWLTSMVDAAQSAMESGEAGARKRLVDYDTPVNAQREIIYALRDTILDGGPEVEADIQEALSSAVDDVCRTAFGSTDDIDTPGYERLAVALTDLGLWAEVSVASDTPTFADITRGVRAAIAGWEAEWRLRTPDARGTLAGLSLTVLDAAWREHLRAVDRLRETITYRSIGQKDPVKEFADEAYALFDEAMAEVRLSTLRGFLALVAPTDEIAVEA